MSDTNPPAENPPADPQPLTVEQRLAAAEAQLAALAPIVEDWAVLRHVVLESRGVIDAHYWGHPSRHTYANFAPWMLENG